MNWGGAASFGDVGDFEDEFERRRVYGASLAIGSGAAGFEVDFGWAPNFFEDTADGDFGYADSNVTTLMANLTIGGTGGRRGSGVRPYVVGGVGLIKSKIGNADDFFNVDTTDWGFNVGGGITGFFSDSVGLRGDLRYFRSLRDDEPDDEIDIALSDFRFWRGSIGLTFRF
jgi:opacity protein-like surface antigen